VAGSWTKRWLLVLALVVVGVGGFLVYLASSPATSWSADFCQPITRVGGADATRLIHDIGPTPTTGAILTGDVTLLRQDVEASLAHAPTRQLRSELAEYDKNLRGAPTVEEVKTALSHFDLVSSTQLAGCGIRPTRR
jgi:hypothetical protein